MYADSREITAIKKAIKKTFLSFFETCAASSDKKRKESNKMIVGEKKE